MQLRTNRRNTNRARSLRQRATPSERVLWKLVRNRRFHQYKFRRQHPLGRWIVDCICLERKLIIELDGGMHVLHAEQDWERDMLIEREGFLVLRIKNHELKNSPELCMRHILTALQRDLHEPPSP